MAKRVTHTTSKSYRLPLGARGTKSVTFDSSGKVLSSRSSYSPAPLSNILGVVLFIILAISFFRILNGSSNSTISFTQFLYWLRDMPQIETGWITGFTELEASIDPVSWGLFAPVATFFNAVGNVFISISGIALWFSAGIAQLVIFVGYVIAFIFG